VVEHPQERENLAAGETQQKKHYPKHNKKEVMGQEGQSHCSDTAGYFSGKGRILPLPPLMSDTRRSTALLGKTASYPGQLFDRIWSLGDKYNEKILSGHELNIL